MYKIFSLFRGFTRIKIMQLFVPSYLKNTYLYQLQTTLIAKKQDLLEFADTIFHPQGGGQPDDKGVLIRNQQQIPILSASSERQTGKIFYKVANPEKFNIGQKILMKIDENVRLRHAKLHSAGHIIDLAVQRLKFGWQASKAYHFQDSPYVEYKAKHQNLEEAANQINLQLQKLLKQNIQIKKEVFSYQQAIQKGIIPQNFKAPIIRVVHFGENNCPCGGTHISDIKQMQKIVVTKIQKKGKNLRVFYEI